MELTDSHQFGIHAVENDVWLIKHLANSQENIFVNGRSIITPMENIRNLFLNNYMKILKIAFVGNARSW